MKRLQKSSKRHRKNTSIPLEMAAIGLTPLEEPVGL